MILPPAGDANPLCAHRLDGVSLSLSLSHIQSLFLPLSLRNRASASHAGRVAGQNMFFNMRENVRSVSNQYRLRGAANPPDALGGGEVMRRVTRCWRSLSFSRSHSLALSALRSLGLLLPMLAMLLNTNVMSFLNARNLRCVLLPMAAVSVLTTLSLKPQWF